MTPYNHRTIEKKWQKYWDKKGLFKTKDAVKGKDNFYLLTEFPYPSGNLHVGHWYAFAVPDILARALRMQGKNVLFPIGFDAFGLPAENAAIKNKLNPRTWTQANIAYMKRQVRSMGASFDWSREVITADPAYYAWTQWQFLQLFKKGLAYQKETAVNWCPKDKTVLANEQVVDGKCERCDSAVEQKMMLQWNIKITDYADRLIDDLAPLNWPEQIKESQRNWIGRSQGAEIDFPLAIEDMKHVVVLHGKGGSPESDFIPWMKAELEKRGYTVEAPTLPSASAPDDVEQAEFIKKNCTVDEHTILVGHSAGGLAAMRLLETTKAGRLVLVGTPYSPTFADGKERPTVSRSINRGYDYAKIRSHVKDIVGLYDVGDPIIPLSDGRAYAKKLGGMFVEGKGTKGHFNGEKEPDVLMATIPTIRVFTTRPDTLFGATYLVVAPEHPLLRSDFAKASTDKQGSKGQARVNNWSEVEKYIEQAKRKTELERLTEQKEKTGVQLDGVEAINPATGEKIPIYVADYVLATYGTGAIMAVPAHDERDHEFAQKFDLLIRQVVAPYFTDASDGKDRVRPEKKTVRRKTAYAFLWNKRNDEYLCLDWDKFGWHSGIIGGVDDGEDFKEAALREIREETGYTNVQYVRDLGDEQHNHFFAAHKDENRYAVGRGMLFELVDDTKVAVAEEHTKNHVSVWIRGSAMEGWLNLASFVYMWKILKTKSDCYTGEGVLINSGKYTGETTKEAAEKITEAFGRKKTTYKLRDWVVSRQRYWGVPIPIIHCSVCGQVAVPDKDLPVKLPEVKDYVPEGSGRSPLAKAKKWVNVRCPQCGGGAERETDTLDTFVDSSWYFLRYTDPKNKKEFASKNKMGHWMPVDLYSGGAEHTTMHLLYSRFWHKALYDLGLVRDSEPYKRRMNRSLILGPDGQKMSKSRGNVIDPDAIVHRLGADTVRIYLAFIGPYNEVSSYPWNPGGVVGVRRFLERIWKASAYVAPVPTPELDAILHKTIKKVGDDIAVMKFNTAISQLMILLNEIEKQKKIGVEQWATFLKLLAPFAPHMAEELWSLAKRKSSIHTQTWPVYDPALLQDTTVTIAIQINGKTRGEVTVPADADKATIEMKAREVVASRLEGKTILRTIIVPGRLVNFVLAS